MTKLELVAVCCVGLAIGAAVWHGARESRTSVRSALTTPAPDPHGLARAAGRAARAGIDPLRPPGLPAGASIDPDTGFLIWLGLTPKPGEQVLPWSVLRALNDVTGAAQIPADMHALDGTRVLMVGFLMPLYKVRDIHEFALVGSHYACCFQRPPGLGEQVIVRLRPGASGLSLMVEPLAVRGVLRIRPLNLHESGEGPLISILEIDGAEAAALD